MVTKGLGRKAGFSQASEKEAGREERIIVL